MRRLVISALAAGDFEKIAQHTERVWGVAQKQRYLGILHAALRRLRSIPWLGRPRDDLEPGYRSLVAGVHVIVYRVGVDVVEVIRVVHGSMDVLDQLSDESAAPDEAEDGP